MNFSKGPTHSAAAVWRVPLGQTPAYLDPSRQEALLFSLGQSAEEHAVGKLG
ncbi:MAG: hypothetical protein P0111_01380 [Nitrospira sp.]|nr:hypothetical protein [Nitrospira sp.]